LFTGGKRLLNRLVVNLWAVSEHGVIDRGIGAARDKLIGDFWRED
jgi:hypothetical protein